MIDKWKKISDEQSRQLDETLKDDPASALVGKQNSVSGGVGYTFGAGTASASINASRDRMKSDYESVQQLERLVQRQESLLRMRY